MKLHLFINDRFYRTVEVNEEVIRQGYYLHRFSEKPVKVKVKDFPSHFPSHCNYIIRNIVFPVRVMRDNCNMAAHCYSDIRNDEVYFDSETGEVYLKGVREEVRRA